MADGKVTQYEGNNGKLALPIPASLTISKNVTADTGLTPPAATFEFTITAQAKANQTVNAVKTTPGADPATSTVEIAFGENGTATFTLTAGQSIEFPNMTNTAYTVVETPAAGFTNTAATVDPTTAGAFDNTQHSVSGTVGTEDASIAFTNNYSVTAIDKTPADLGITLTKTIENRDFEQGDSFSFTISASQATQNAPLPTNPTITVTPTEGTSVNAAFTNDNAFHFTLPSGPDGFRYIIRENATKSHGVSIDNAVYRLIVRVNDNGKGALEVGDTTLEKWDNQSNTWVAVDNKVATFNNTYSATEDVIALAGTKVLSGRTMTATDNFTFTVEAGGWRALNSSDEFTEDANQPMPVPTTATATQAGTITFGDMTFDEDDIDKEYRYVITENEPDGAQDADGNPDNGFQHNGITYDQNQKVVIVKVASESSASGDAVRATVCDENGTPITESSAFTVNNEYHATGELTGSTNLQVSKTLSGRAWGEDETFTFQLVGHDDAPMPATVTGSFTTTTVSKNQPTTAFGNIVFDEEDLSDGQGGYLTSKKFSYTISELGASVDGLTISKATYDVEVTVTNNGNGTLDVSSVMTQTASNAGTAINPGTTVDDNVAAFENTYTSTFTSTPISLDGAKVLTNTKWPTGKTLDQNNFQFCTEAQNGAPSPTGGTTSAVRNTNNSAGQDTDTPGVFEGSIYGLLREVTVSQSDMVGDDGNPVATKDFQYIITEYNRLSVGYTYDESQYRVTITATDDQVGHITASISKIEQSIDEGASWTEVWAAGSATDDDDVVVFRNNYEPSNETLTSDDLGLTKQLTGNRSTALGENEFTFTMSVTAADDSSDATSVVLPNPASVGNTADDTAENGVYSGAINFGDITFTQAGKFTIHVTENMPEGATNNGDGTWTYNGVTGNSTDHTFTYNVVDRSGSLVATLDSAQSTGGETFTNTYAATGSESFDGVKNITGREFEEGDTFAFQVNGTGHALDDENVPINAPKPTGVSEDNWQLTINPTSGASATLEFGTVTFTQPGVYTYTFSEYEGELGGMTYDTGDRTVVFTVTDNGTGTLNVEVTDGNLTNATTWTNRYQPQGEESYATTGLNGTKTFTGRDMLAEEKFEFVLEPATDDADSTGQRVPTSQLVTIGGIGIENTTAEVPGLKNADGSDTGSFDFGNITVKPIANTFDGTGTFKFYVHEVVPDGVTDQNQTANGITYDTHVGTLTLVVTDTDADGKHTGELTITPRFDEGAFAFVNNYEATEVEFDTSTQLNFQKVLDGRDWMSTDSFRFQVTAAQGTPMPDGGEQVSGSNARIVTLTSDAVDGTPVNFNLGTIRYAFADMAQGATVDAQTGVRTKTFTYNVAELNTPNIVGVDYSAANFRVEVTVTDDNTGALKVTDVKVIQTQNDDNTMTPDQEIELASGAAATFTNYYHADMAPYGFTGVKVYNDTTEGGKPLTNGMFTFELRPTGANAATAPMPATGTEGTGENRVCTTTNSGGTFTFNNIEFTQEHDGETFTYEIREQGTDGNGMNFDETVYTATVRVTTDTSTGVAQIKPEVTIETLPESGQMTFTNTYEPTPATLEGADALHGTKTVDGRNILDGETFGFTLAPYNQAAQDAIANDQITIDGNWSDANTATASTTETGSATADFAFGTMTFTQVTGNTPYQFVITENLAEGMTEDNPVKDGLTYDRHQTIVTITVTDNGDGTLKAEATYDNSNGVTDADKAETTKAAFTNVYTAIGTVTGSDAFDVSKTFTGRENDEWTANDVFTFELTGSEGAPMPEGSDGQTKTITVSSDQLNDESVGINNFGDIAYGNADRGNTYTYTIREVAGNMYGVTYSQAEYQVTVKVDDNATPNGQLSIETSMTQVKDDQGAEANNPAETAAFANTYKVDEDSKDVSRVDGDVTTNVNGQLVGVGDTLEYTIHWVNDAVDDAGVAQAATVTITDNVPAGLTVDASSISNDGRLSEDGRTITWTIKTDAAAEGDVNYKATVDDTAVEGGELTNTAQVAVGDNDPHQNVEATVNVPQKSMDETGGKVDGDIQVGDVLTYTIEYANTGDQPVDITITDVVSAGLTVDENSISNGGTLGENNTITWNLTDVAADTEGTVTFKATVNEGALTTSVDNQATLKVGDDPEIKTNTVPVTVDSGNLEISKTVEVNADQGTTVDANKLFEFTVEFKTAGDNGVELTGSYGIEGAYNAEGEAITTVRSGDKVYLHHGNTAKVTGLPEGAVYTVTETEGADDGYTQTAPVDADGRAVAATGTIVKGDTPAKAEFVNAYDAASAEGVPTGFTFTKVFEGREWTDAYSFQFKLTPEGDAPMPAADPNNNIVAADDGVSLIRTVTGPQDTGEATFDFGSITYNKVGTYKYTVSEVKGDNAGITYSKNVTEVKVDVEDHGNGKLVATATIPNNTFTNTYKTGEVVYDTAAGLDIVKNMTGHAIGAGDFTFTMTGKDEASIARLNNGQPLEFSTKGAELGEGAASNTATETIKALTNLTFTQQDVGKTYTYTVAEENGGDDINGVTYDGTTYEVKFVVTENGQGTLNVETVVNNESQGVVSGAIATNALPVQLVFNNNYDAGTVVVGGDTGVAFTGGKQLANRPLENGEFTFNVYDANDVLVTSGVNNAEGTINFDGITYDMAKLNADEASGAATAKTNEDGSTVYKYVYTITEDQTDFEQDGITAVVSSIDITVEVTDDNQGHLTAKVVTPAEDIQFKNIYGNGEDGSFTSNLKGNKVVAVDSGDNAPGRDGFQFEVTVPEGAPEPERTTATSDESGNVDFGEIVFTMENVFGDTGDKVEVEGEAVEGEDAGIETMSAQRTETFEYVVSEVNDGKPGVTYDTNSYTVTYTVTDLGNGKLDVQKTVATGAQQGNDFTFTNRYRVTAEDSSLTGNGGFVINKTLTANTGRTLADGEFSFALTDVVTGEVVKTATNAADGTVSFPAVTFTEPGTYNYTLSEVEGDAANVTYDTDQYNVTAKVTDMGDGTLKVEWTVEGVDPSEAIVFENTYEADPTSIAFKAAKVLDGRELTDGEFAFELRENGKVIDTATNDADGTVAFEKVEYTEPGAHDYEIAEVKGDDSTITYDDTVFTVHVNVVDNIQTGSLDASDWSYGENGSPVFHNTYTEPPAPVEPDEVIPATGDAAVAAVAATVAIGGTLVTAGYVTSKKRGE